MKDMQITLTFVVPDEVEDNASKLLEAMNVASTNFLKSRYPSTKAILGQVSFREHDLLAILKEAMDGDETVKDKMIDRINKDLKTAGLPEELKKAADNITKKILEDL